MGVRQLREYTRETGIAQRYQKPVKNRLTPNQLQDLQADLSRFYTEDKGIDTVAWFKSCGALTSDGSVVITNYKRAKYNPAQTTVIEPQDCDPILYEQLLEDLEQYYEWVGKREYAIKKQNKEYEKIALTI